MRSGSTPSDPSGSRRPLEAGDRGPPFALPDQTGTRVTPLEDGAAGRPMLLAFFSGDDPQRWSDEIVGLRDRQDQVAALGGLIFGITTRSVEANRDLHAAAGLDFPLLSDPGGEILAAYGIDPRNGGAPATTYLMDRCYRVQERISASSAAPQAEAVITALRMAVEAERAVTLGVHPPVLVIPRVLTPEDCAQLIEVWHRPVRVWTTDGLVSAGYDQETSDFKVRNEAYGKVMQYVVRDPVVQTALDQKIGRRIGPELRKAFQTTVSQREDYRIACYDSAEGGSLPAHRDNPTPRTRHRRFTLTVALNAGEYQGGQLCFREYGPQRYSVETGTAIIWSAALLHEVSEVTAGRRFILGTHLYGN